MVKRGIANKNTLGDGTDRNIKIMVTNMLKDVVEKVNNIKKDMRISEERWKKWKRSKRNASKILLITNME